MQSGVPVIVSAADLSLEKNARLPHLRSPMAQPFVMDSRFRSLLVLVPALILAVWIASEAASEEFLVPLIATIGFVSLVVFSVFVQSVRFETAVLNLLLVGYLVGNRGFAEITVAKPLYPGEICMVIVLLAMTARYILTRELPDFSGTLARTILIFLVLGAVRLALDFQDYRLDAVRDAAMVYYALYFFFGRQMAVSQGSRAVLEKCLKFSCIALVPISLAHRFAPGLLLNNGYMGLLFQKDDLLTTFAAVIVLILYTRPKMFRQAWPRIAMILFFIAFVFNGITRASLVALVAGSVPLLIAGHRKFMFYPVVAGVLGVTLLAGLTVTFEGGELTELDAVTDKFYSIVDFTGTHQYTTDLGRYKSDTNEFRRTLWQSFVDETNATSPLFGRGFGYDFIARFLNGNIESDPGGGLRSAHNFYITLYGRMGILGSLVLGAITWQIIIGGIRAGQAARQGLLPVSDLGFWCATWAILTSAAFGVVLEGPVGAVVFWMLLGVAVRTQQDALAAAREATEEEPENVPVLTSAGGARLGYQRN